MNIVHESPRNISNSRHYTTKSDAIEVENETFDRQTFYKAISSRKAISRTAEVVTAILLEAGISPNRRGLVLALIGLSAGSSLPFELTNPQLAEKLYGLANCQTADELKERQNSIARMTRREIQKLMAEQKAAGITLVQIEEGWISGYGSDHQTNMPSKISLPVLPLIQEALNEFKAQKSGDRMREAARITITANRANLAKIPPKKTRRREPDLRAISRKQCLTWAEKYAALSGDKLTALDELITELQELKGRGGRTHESGGLVALQAELTVFPDAYEPESPVPHFIASQEGGTGVDETPNDLPDELRAVEAFASVEGELDQVLILDDAKPKDDQLLKSSRSDFAAFLDSLPALKERAESQRLSIVGRIRGPVLQVDDCDRQTALLLSSFAFATFETSPQNFQCWLAFKDDDDKEAAASRLIAGLKAILPGTQANKGSGGAIRWPGTTNHKPNRRQSDGGFPAVKVARVQLGRTVTPSELDDAGLLAMEEKPPQPWDVTPACSSGGVRTYDHYLKKAPLKLDGLPDRSRADMAFVNACWRAGMVEETSQALLMQHSERAKEKGWKYVQRTVRAGQKFIRNEAI